jgi:hypothetical protein
MAHVHQAEPRPTTRPVLNVPSLTPIFSDTTEYANAVLQSIEDISRSGSNHRDKALRERVTSYLRDIRRRLGNIQAEVLDLRLANYEGLQLIFDRPQCE